MTSLTSISQVKRRCQALAALDLILSPEWQYRYFSFNAAWATGQQMASMRDGCGDEWFCLFHESGWAALKGLAHESVAWAEGGPGLAKALQAAIPGALGEFAREPAFRWESTTFACYCLSEPEPWVNAADGTKYARLAATGAQELLALVNGTPADYVDFADNYFERKIDLALVEHVFSLRPITPEIAARLSPETDWPAIEQELFGEIGYLRTKDP